MPKKQKNKLLNKSGQTDASYIDEIYQDELPVIKKPIIKSHSGVRMYYFLVALLFGLLGGILGELFVNNYFSSQGLSLTSLWPQDNNTSIGQQVIILKSEEVNQTESELLTLVETVGASVVGIFPKKESGENIWDDFYLPDEQLGNGLVLTADGWIVTTDQIIDTNKDDLVVVLANKQIFPIVDKVVDEATGAVFLKIDAHDLKVVKFGERDTEVLGERLLVLANALANGGLKIVVTNLEKLNYKPITKAQDLLQSSESFDKKILISNSVSSEFYGSPVINMRGEMVGLIYGDKQGNTVLPVDYFSPIVKTLLSVGEIVRPVLGVNYLDLSHILGISEQISEGRSQGAVLYGDKDTVAAVIADSAAQKAGLKAGDIIIAVNDESVDARHSLTELIQEYRVGDAVKLKLIFQGTEREVDVVLVGSNE